MIKALLEGWERKDLGPDGGTYDELLHPKLELHTWEGTNWAAAEKAMASYPAHLAANWKDRIKRLYVPLNKHAYANKGPESDDELVIQFEMAGFSAKWHEVSDNGCRFYGDCIKQICDAIQAPIVFPKQGFHGPSEGIKPYIATAESPIRFKNEAELRAFSGICGHQHMPSPDTHWDPGLPPFDRMGLTGDEIDMLSDVDKKQLDRIEQFTGMIAYGLHPNLGNPVNFANPAWGAPGQFTSMVSSIAAGVASLVAKGVDVDEAEIAKQLAPLLPHVITSFDSKTFAEFAKAVNDEADRRERERLG